MGFTGVTKRDSKVPRSHSRAITTEVSMTPTMVIMSMIRPGMKNQVLELASLNHMRETMEIPPLPVSPSFAIQADRELST